MPRRWSHRSKDRIETQIGELELLATRYDRIIESTMTINQIIHRTFYLSVVAAGILIGTLPQVSSILSRGPLYLFGALLFVAMYGWNQTYINSRSTLIEQMAAITRRIEETEYDFEDLDAGTLFSANLEYEQAGWESLKETMLQLYYLGMTGLLLLILTADVLFTLEVVPSPLG